MSENTPNNGTNGTNATETPKESGGAAKNTALIVGSMLLGAGLAYVVKRYVLGGAETPASADGGAV